MRAWRRRRCDESGSLAKTFPWLPRLRKSFSFLISIALVELREEDESHADFRDPAGLWTWYVRLVRV